MADTTDSKTDSTAPPIPLDDEGKQLQLLAEKAKYRKAIADAESDTGKARFSWLSDLVPDVKDAPKGLVTLGEQAGAFGPCLAHKGIADAAATIAGEVKNALGAGAHRVLVVDNASLLNDDWSWRMTKDRLDVVQKRLSPIPDQLAAAYETAKGQPSPPSPPLGHQPAGDERHLVAPHAGADMSFDLGTDATADIAGLGGSLGAGVPAPTTPTAPAGGGATQPSAAFMPAAAFAGAVDLFGLLRTDYGLTAATIATSSSELAVLTAGALAGGDDPQVEQDRDPQVEQDRNPQVEPDRDLQVELDGFMLTPEDPAAGTVLATLTAVMEVRRKIMSGLAELDILLAMPAIQIADLKNRTDRVQQAWDAEKAATNGPRPDTLTELGKEIDRLVGLQREVEACWAPANAAAASARQAVAETDAIVAALLQAPDGHEPPLKTALTRERLHSQQGSWDDKFTHVLLVRLDEARGDVVTRNSILGTSGRLSFLAGVNASWLLFDVEKRSIKRGGQAEELQRMLFDIESAKAERGDVGPAPDGTFKKDPLLGMERWAKGAVLAVAFFLLIIAVAGIVNLVVLR